MKYVLTIIVLAIAIIASAFAAVLLIGGLFQGEHYCTAEERGADVCSKEYVPACGWFDPGQVQCIRYPCAADYANSCEACSDGKVLYWTTGACPE